MAATIMQHQAAARRSQPSEDLAKQFGGLVVVEYLINLFGESPKELFSRIDVLAVLDHVRNDRSLFPEAAVAMSDSIKTAGRTRRWIRPKSLDGSAHNRQPLN